MTTYFASSVYTSGEFARRWSEHAWIDSPAVMIAFPFPGGVLFGAEGQDIAQRVSFFLNPDDAIAFGQRLIDAAKEARIK